MVGKGCCPQCTEVTMKRKRCQWGHSPVVLAPAEPYYQATATSCLTIPQPCFFTPFTFAYAVAPWFVFVQVIQNKKPHFKEQYHRSQRRWVSYAARNRGTTSGDAPSADQTHLSARGAHHPYPKLPLAVYSSSDSARFQTQLSFLPWGYLCHIPASPRLWGGNNFSPSPRARRDRGGAAALWLGPEQALHKLHLHRVVLAGESRGSLEVTVPVLPCSKH